MIELGLSALLASLSAWILLRPHFASGSGPIIHNDLNHDSEERVAQMLRDLELDFMTGKLSSQEHSQMKSKIEQELAESLTQK